MAIENKDNNQLGGLEEKDIKETRIESKKTNTRNAILWFSYDMADTFFSQAVISLAFTPYALMLGVQKGWTLAQSFIIVAIFMAASNLLIAILGPILGSISDIAGKRKPAVIIVASIMVAATATIAFWANFWWGCFFFIIANFCYQAGRMFYDAQIPFVAETKKRGIIQAFGGSMATFGSVIAIVLGLVINTEGRRWGKSTSVSTGIWEVAGQVIDPDTINYQALRWLFLASAVVIILLSIPYLFHKERQSPPTEVITRKEYAKGSLVAFKTSLKAIIKDRNSWIFFLSWFFITDAANTTILYMVPVIESMGGEYIKDLTYFVILAGILIGTVFGIITGFLLNKWGPKRLYLIIGAAWFIAIVIFILTGVLPEWIIWFGALFIGLGFGGIWIVGRQFIMILAPPSKLAQYGGFQKIAGRVSAIVSPLLFGLMMYISSGLTLVNAMRVALGSLLFLFSIGIFTTTFIKDPFKRYLSGERAPYKGIYDEN